VAGTETMVEDEAICLGSPTSLNVEPVCVDAAAGASGALLPPGSHNALARRRSKRRGSAACSPQWSYWRVLLSLHTCRHEVCAPA
jgi:hypothetical protein